jgi:hypothetical protein
MAARFRLTRYDECDNGLSDWDARDTSFDAFVPSRLSLGWSKRSAEQPERRQALLVRRGWGQDNRAFR